MDNINLIRKIAWSFHNTTGKDWDDLFQEAALGYFEALESYDPNKGKLSTHVWCTITNHLITYLNKEKKTGPPTVSLDDITRDFPVEKNGYMERLSQDAQMIVKTILDNPRRYASLHPRVAQWRIVQQMRRRGWTRVRIQTGISNLKQVFNTI